MCIAEAALYGDLVKHLRDHWAEEAAQFNESSIATERTRIDELIRAWFFTPQDDLHGLTPRQVVRNEEKGKPNVVPHDHLDDLFHDDCPICQMMRDEVLSEEGDEWHFGLAPDLTLLDEYDLEGYDAKWADDNADQAAEDPDERITNQPPRDARQWLNDNLNPHCFAGNRFYDKQEALDFVNRLYELGAVRVWVDNILDEPYRLREEGGPYADTLIVELPEDRLARAKLHEVFEYELHERQGLDLEPCTEDDTLIFWWD
jgi:hypothetical protein